MIILPCPDCGGDKGWEVFTGGYNPRNGEPHTRWEPCCETGEIEIETLPLDLDDLTPLIPVDTGLEPPPPTTPSPMPDGPAPDGDWWG